MRTRLWTRLLIAVLSLSHLLRGWRRRRPVDPRRILVIAPLLAGDALLLAALIAKLRQRHPSSELRLVVGRAVLSLFAGRPYGVEAVVYDERDPATLLALRRRPAADLAIVTGEPRFGWLARALGARWIVAFDGAPGWLRTRAPDERVALPGQPAAWSDIVATLVPGPPPLPYRAGDWPDPPFTAFEFPAPPYCVLHVESSSSLKHWDEPKWFELARWLRARGYTVVWSAGRGGTRLVERIDPSARFDAIGCRLDLAQVWHLVKRAALLVSVDTSVGHIGKLTGTPTLVLFGPTPAGLMGPGEFLRASPWHHATVDDFPCRDRRVVFKRELAWVRRCDRGTNECPAPRCMQAIGIAQVEDEVNRLIGVPEPT